MNNKLSDTQSVLSIGYIFLIIPGIIKEGLIYGQIGINILNYSDIQDILISLIATMFADLTSVILCLIIILIVLFFPVYVTLF